MENRVGEITVARQEEGRRVGLGRGNREFCLDDNEEIACCCCCCCNLVSNMTALVNAFDISNKAPSLGEIYVELVTVVKSRRVITIDNKSKDIVISVQVSLEEKTD